MRPATPDPLPAPFDPLGMETPQEDLAFLRALVREQLENHPLCRVVEVGSWVGRTALNFLRAGNAPRVNVYCVDTWEGTDGDKTGILARRHGPDTVFETFAANCGGNFIRQILPCRGTSEQWARVWPFQVDLVFLDGDHRYESVLADIKAWMPHVKHGGILCGHDYGIFPGVSRAVHEVLPGVRMAGRCLWWKRL